MAKLMTDLEALTALVRPAILELWQEIGGQVLDLLASGELLPNSFHDETEEELNHAVLVFTLDAFEAHDYFGNSTENVLIDASVKTHGFEAVAHALSDGLDLFRSDDIKGRF